MIDKQRPPPSSFTPAAACGPAVDFGVLFDAAPAPYLVISPQLDILAVNRAYLRLAGRSSADLLGRCIFDAFPENPADPHGGVANLRASLQRVISTGSVDKMPVQRYDVATEAGGAEFRPRFWKAVNTPVTDAAGMVSFIIHSVEELTGTYHHHRRGLRNVLANLTDRIRDLKTAEEIHYEAAAILGEALGASRVGYGAIDQASAVMSVVRDWCAPGIDTLAGATALHSYGAVIDDLKLGKAIVIASVDDDPGTAPQAATLRALGAAALVNAPVIEDGRLAGVLYVNDATPRDWRAEELVLIREVAARIHTAGERLQVVAALRESEAKFRTIADAMPQMVWSTLPDGYHDYYNEQWYRYTGVPHNSTDGDGWNGIFHPEDQERAWATWRACLETGNTYEIQYRLRHHSGVYRWVLGRALPVRDEQGRITRWMGTCTDIHDQKQAEDELRQASGRKDEFLAMLAHELRNPLAPISSAAQLLMLSPADAQRVRRSGEIIVRQVRHLSHLVDDLLDVSRVTRGLVQIERTPLDLRDILYSAVEQARPLVEARQHHLTVDVGAAPTCVAGDRTRLIQVVVNLLNNAAKYTAKGGHIRLSLGVDAGEATIMVADNGSGIAAELLPFIFDLFIQAERTPDRTQGGLGLGLALVKRITALHDGSVHALSDGLGQGSTFMMILPLLDTDMPADGAGAAPPAPAPAVTPGTARVLIVDDNPDGMESLGALLAAQGHHVLMAEDGAGALRMAASRAIDVFILDIGLPDMPGYELARKLRATDSGRKALIIALTGYGQAQDRLLSQEAGFDHHFVKPVDIDALSALLHQE